MNVSINNEYGYTSDYSYLDEVIKLTLAKENASDAIFEVTFVDEEKIREINRDNRGIDKVTDVISFAFEDNLDFIMPKRFLGEIYICIPRMQEQAKMYEHSEKRELAFLTTHGLLHLLGYDHQIKKEEEVMFALQEEILEELNIRR